MGFTIHHNKPGYKSYDDSHTMQIKDSGVIEVTQNGQQVMLFGPGYWTYVEPVERQTVAPSAPSRIR